VGLAQACPNNIPDVLKKAVLLTVFIQEVLKMGYLEFSFVLKGKIEPFLYRAIRVFWNYIATCLSSKYFLPGEYQPMNHAGKSMQPILAECLA